jgi:hypothetical protein
MVAASYTSFLIRLWRLAQGQMRVKIEHIQTGEVAQVNSLEEATVWLELHSASAGPEVYQKPAYVTGVDDER